VPAGALFAPRFLYLPLLLAIPFFDGALRDALGRTARYAAPVLLALGIAGAHVRSRVYHDDLAYWGEQVRWIPGDATAHNELGLAWEDRGSLVRAREEFLRAAELDPEYSRPWTNLGRLALAAGELDEAERCYRTAVERGRRNAVARFNLGSLLLKRGRPDEAAEELAEATRLVPGLQPAWRALARALHAAGESEEALLAVARALELDPSDEDARKLERSIVEARVRER
jgi:tetratricopeptide (TPR) repeat protein